MFIFGDMSTLIMQPRLSDYSIFDYIIYRLFIGCQVRLSHYFLTPAVEVKHKCH